MSTIKIIGDAALSASIEFEPSGAIDTHVALSDPHTQYELESANTAAAILTKLLTVDGAGSGLDADLLDGNSSAAFLRASGATTGATSSRQVFTNGITAPSMRPASNSTEALKWENASGTALLTGDTTNMDVKRSGVPTADSSVITRGYSLSKLMNLIPNGSGLLGNNYNFSGLAFDATETHGGGGSFKYTGAYSAAYSDEFVPVDPENYYRLMAWAKAGDIGGGSYDAANVQRAGIIEFDIDKLTIAPYFVMRYGSSAQTTLAAQLNPGDTTVSLTSATGWAAGGSQFYERHFNWYPYTNSFGYTYANYTYSRNTSRTYYSYGSYANGAWLTSGISGNTITLVAPWTGPALAAGTVIMNSSDGGSFKYILMSNANVPNSWQRYEGDIGGIDIAQINTSTKFSYGTAFIKIVFLMNYPSTISTNTIRYSDIKFTEMSVKNLERFNTSGDLVLRSYSSGTRPTFGTAGRVVWNTTTSRPNFDTGSGWILADGTAA